MTRMLRRLLMHFGAVAGFAAGSVIVMPVASAAADAGMRDGSFGAAFTGSPTASKPESKLWYAGGQWWASMFDELRGQHRIRKLVGTGWVDAGTTLDPRAGTRDDVLWDAANSKLYVASHTYTTTSAGGGTGADGRLFRYSYDAASQSYAPDGGFPIAIGSPVTETLVLDADSSGRLWAAWNSGNRVYVNHTDGTDSAWGEPYIIPGSEILDPDDISSVLAFGGNRIGVMYSDQADGHMHFAVHADGAADGAWAIETITTGASSDDHINLKAASSGQVFAAVKNSDKLGAPLTFLAKRSTGGSWSSTPFGVEPQHTRPIVLLNEGAGELRMIATCPQPPETNGQSGGDICEKVTSIANPSFDSSSAGTPIISQSGSPGMNNATSTKQNLSGLTGVVVLAANDDTDVYWHSQRPLGGTPPALTANFGATPTAGVGPRLDVEFSDASAGPVRSSRWSFGDGATSRARNPSHRYSAPGTYTVTLDVGDDTGRTDPETKAGLIVVGGGPGPGPGPGAGGTPGPGAGAGGPTPGAGGDASGLRIALKARTTEVPYGASVTLRAAVTGNGHAGARLRLQGAGFPFLTPPTDLLSAAAGRDGTRTFTLRALKSSTRVLVVADGGAESNVLTLRSAARVTVTSMRRAGARTVIRGRVRPATRDGLVDVQLRNTARRYAQVARVKVRADGSFRLSVRAASGRQLRVVARPRDGGAHVVGKTRVLRVPRR